MTKPGALAATLITMLALGGSATAVMAQAPGWDAESLSGRVVVAQDGEGVPEYSLELEDGRQGRVGHRPALVVARR